MIRRRSAGQHRLVRAARRARPWRCRRRSAGSRWRAAGRWRRGLVGAEASSCSARSPHCSTSSAPRVSPEAPATPCPRAPAPTPRRCRPARQVLANRDADGVEVERAAQRLAERDEPLELFGAMLRCPGGHFRRPRPSLDPGDVAAVLVKHEGAGQQDQRRHQRQAALPLDLARVVQQARDRRRKDDDQRRCKGADEQQVLAAEQLHWEGVSIAASGVKLAAMKTFGTPFDSFARNCRVGPGRHGDRSSARQACDRPSPPPSPRRAAAKPVAVRKTAPPLPTMGFAPVRPMDIVRATYDFAAQHPEIL